MAFDANGIVCVDIHKASLSLITTEEIRKTALCKIYSTVTFDADGTTPRAGGIHDARLGPMDGDPRRSSTPCVVCSALYDCPGHLGYIDLNQPVYHPLFVQDLVRLLKAVCLRCKRLKINAGKATVYLKKFQMVQMGELGLLARFEQAATGVSNRSDQSSLDKRVELKKILKDFREKELDLRRRNPKALLDLRQDISESGAAIESWRRLKAELLAHCTLSHCHHCGLSYKVNISRKEFDSTIVVSWNYDSECPLDHNTLMKLLDSKEESTRFPAALNSDGQLLSVIAANKDATTFGSASETLKREHRTLGKRGKALGLAKLQAYQLVPIIRDLFASVDRPLLIFMIPEANLHGHMFFFQDVIPVSANKFRPITPGLRGSGAILHPRSQGLLGIIEDNAKVGFALASLRYNDPMKALEDCEGGLEMAVPISVGNWRDKSEVEEHLGTHRGNYNLLNTYCRNLQAKVNAYVDSTKTNVRNPPPAVRQWMEKKQGAIRQKMMGKRVNFAARTTIAPDAMINTNEIGIPMPFAMKLTIGESAGDHNVNLLCRLLMNGSNKYPGCNGISLPSGRRLDFFQREIPLHQRKLYCNQIRSHVEQMKKTNTMIKPFVVYRHLRDGDVVIMNRQPSLHRASMMAHFIRVLTGQKTFRLNYANCGSYNADFDGDEMNLHCPQDYTARAEAAYIVNSDCNYNVVKSGEPLRGLIQDHVIGGNFLTVRGTFLTKDIYCSLIYTGIAAFIDKGEKLKVLGNRCHLVHQDFSAGDPYARALGNCNIPVILDPPVIWKPQKLWTGKQIVTSVLKTLVDSVAILQYGGSNEAGEKFKDNYNGINLISKSKTPGDAWNGILDKDNEEQKIVIRHSELLQGVFDKSQFGASSYGLVHLCYELMGPRVAGMLLSVFSRIFGTYLQIRGFSCSSGDFQITQAGEENRNDMILKCTTAGTYLQESFISSVYQQMKWKQPSVNEIKALVVESSETKLCSFSTISSFTRKMRSEAAAKREYGSVSQKELRKLREKYEDFLRVSQVLTNTGKEKKNRQEHVSQVPGWPKEPISAPDQKINKKVNVVDTEVKNSWNFCRFLSTRIENMDWRYFEVRGSGNTIKNLKKELKLILELGCGNPRLRDHILKLLTNQIEELKFYFPKLGRLILKEFSEDFIETSSRQLGLEPPPSIPGFCGPPIANLNHRTIGGVTIVEGDGSLRKPVLYHPSWAWRGDTDISFNSPLRYLLRLMKKTGEEKRLSSNYLVMPNEFTRMKMERLVNDHFKGRQQVFLDMFDKFFQANMGKISSKNNDLVSGDVTLYPFPHNGFSSMVTTGAKGSKVNFAMICGMLSQQSLEGKRVPLMISGRTHPAFGQWDLGARAGGLITDRFLTGLRPPDYFFHCMAGREGLVDTAVKTARSGYLQRCVIKSLEGVTVSYDGTVRDSDGTIVQFMYGEDGGDVCKSSYLSNLADLVSNPAIMQAKYCGHQNKILNSRLQELEIAETQRGFMDPFEDPMTKEYPPLQFPGSISELYHENARKQLTKALQTNMIMKRDLISCGILEKNSHDTIFYTSSGRMTNLGKLLRLKYRDSLAEPGDAVGCLAAQSMGEPATQMTLNTFHLAGHGAANVTLGIPRLREILQTAGDATTPVLYLPVKGCNQEEIKFNSSRLMLGFRDIKLTDIINSVGVEANIIQQKSIGSNQSWCYETTLQFENLVHFCRVVTKYTPQKIINFTMNRVVREMMKTVNRMMGVSSFRTAEEMWDSEDDDLNIQAEKIVFERNFKTIFDKKKAHLEILKGAGYGFGSARNNNGEDLDFITGADTTTFVESGNTADNEDQQGNQQDDDQDALPDSDASRDDSEREMSDVEAQHLSESDQSETTPKITTVEESDTDMEESDSAKKTKVEKKDQKRKLDKIQFDSKKKCIVGDFDQDIQPDGKLEDAAIWTDGEGAAFKPKIMPEDAFRYLIDIKVCCKTWRIVVKFGWPVKRCPRKIEFLPYFTKIVKKQILQPIPGVSNPHIVGQTDAHTSKSLGSKEKVACEIQCQGSNLAWIAQLSDQYLDHSKVTTNDIRAMFKFYGVECGRACVIGELARVFGVYGITVDYRHLSLIADSMTASGNFRAFSRLGMSFNPSPLLQMSFETSIKFLTEGVGRGAVGKQVGRRKNVFQIIYIPLPELLLWEEVLIQALEFVDL